METEKPKRKSRAKSKAPALTPMPTVCHMSIGQGRSIVWIQGNPRDLDNELTLAEFNHVVFTCQKFSIPMLDLTPPGGVR